MGGKEKALINLLDRPLISYVLEKVSGKAAKKSGKAAKAITKGDKKKKNYRK